MFIAALFTIGRKQNKMRYIYSIEFYPAVKENETVGKRDPAEAKAEGGQTADNTGLADAQSTEGLERHAGREGKG